MFLTHLKSAHALCPAGWRKSFLFTNHTQRSGRPEHSTPEIGVVLDVVRAVVRTVVRTVRNGVRVLEHPTRRRSERINAQQHATGIRRYNLFPCYIGNLLTGAGHPPQTPPVRSPIKCVAFYWLNRYINLRPPRTQHPGNRS